MNKLALLSLTSAVLLAACGTTQPTAATPSGSFSGFTGRHTTLSRVASTNLPDPAQLVKTGREADRTQELVVGYADRASLDRLATHLGATVRSTIPPLRLALLVLPEQLSVSRTATALSLRPVAGLRYAQANTYDGQRLPVPAATPLGTQNLTAQADGDPLSVKQWWITQIGADQVRSVATGKGIVVGVVDDDLNRQHEDLKADGKIVTGIDTSTLEELTPDLPLTTGDHGSGSAGTIAERLGNGVGGAGVAPDAILMPVRIFTDKGFTGSYNVALGIVYAVDHGARVLNNSWGGGGYSQVLKDAVDYALSKNVVVVGSAGNDHANQMTGLGAFTGVINVGASAGDDMKADFSNLGLRVDVYAPGDNGLTTYSEANDGYGSFGGTSMAAPVISGAAALLLEANPALTPYQIKNLLISTGDAMKDPRTQGFKRVNVKAALAAVKAGTVPADGGSVEVAVSDLVERAPVDGSDVILTPLDGQNKGMDYIGATGGYRLEGQTAADTGFAGYARFYGVEPGRYSISVSGPGVNSYGGVRVTAAKPITVESGKTVRVAAEQQVDFYEYSDFDADTGTLIRNNLPATATNFTALPAVVTEDGLLLGGAFDNSNHAYSPAPTGADVDFLAFKVPAGKTITVQGLSSALASTAGVKVDLLNAAGTVVAGGTAGVAVPELGPSVTSDSKATYTSAAGGTFIVRFSNTTAKEGLGAVYAGFISIK
ncbi:MULTISPECIES: S8 family peptidase [Deinococcus]|uniref:S8 family serine peptidase n=1 Tax=Deinococcus rufus TaxID=2136097 RepID=A0ABV7Z872_9DEIO|nr:S8 family serine peptidase [Deinococcus sp. AB2017081]WQE96523.1 S8 family serine peptidase [Deinococcus sp. AB2017081]